MRNTGYGRRNTECGILTRDTEYGIGNTEYGIQNTEYGIWNTEYGCAVSSVYSIATIGEFTDHRLQITDYSLQITITVHITDHGSRPGL